MRMFTPIAALLDREVTLSASGSLRSRPMGMVEELETLGVACRTDHGRAPIIVKGPMKGGDIKDRRVCQFAVPYRTPYGSAALRN